MISARAGSTDSHSPEKIGNPMRFSIATPLALIFILTSQLMSAEVILNEYNAVSRSKQLDEGNGKDLYFGTIEGNGGNWFELLIIEDHADMRGWQFSWTEDETVGDTDEIASGVITLSNADLWSDIRDGSILTFTETVDANVTPDVSTATDTSYDPFNVDWWINVATQEEQVKGAAGLATTTTNDGEPGDFSVGKDDWMITILNANNETVFGPAGEGIGDAWAGGGVGSEEGGSLEGPVASADVPLTLDVWKSITPVSEYYDDTGSTSFGGANSDYDEINEVFITTQDLSALRDPVTQGGGILGDFNDDQVLNADDIDLLTSAVAANDQDRRFDVNLDGAVSAADRDTWVNELKQTYFGDANLDDEFNSNDIVVVLTAGEYEDALPGNSTWATGDWNGDTEFTSSDLVTALTGGGYEMGPRQAVAAVPEPTSLVLLLIGLLPFWRRQR